MSLLLLLTTKNSPTGAPTGPGHLAATSDDPGHLGPTSNDPGHLAP